MNFREREKQVIESKDTCCISTLSKNGWPHTVPVSYIFLGDKFYVPTSQDSKKIRNLRKNPKATIIIDDEMAELGVMIECTSNILEGKDSKPVKEYMTNLKRWQNNDSTLIIRLEPLRKASWFLNEVPSHES